MSKFSTVNILVSFRHNRCTITAYRIDWHRLLLQPYIQKKFLIHSNSLPAVAKAMKSDSIVERDIHVCFLEVHEIAPPLMIKTQTDFHITSSAYLSNTIEKLYRINSIIVLCRYLRGLVIAFECTVLGFLVYLESLQTTNTSSRKLLSPIKCARNIKLSITLHTLIKQLVCLNCLAHYQFASNIKAVWASFVLKCLNLLSIFLMYKVDIMHNPHDGFLFWA